MKRRSVSSSSLPQYFSAVRQMQLALMGHPVAQYPFLFHVVRAYRSWEEDEYPLPEVRCGVPATIAQAIWGLGMSTSAASVLRDSAFVIFAFCLNGLRESSVTSLRAEDVAIADNEISARCAW